MAAATGPVWFQLYVFRDRAISASLVQRAEAAGCKAVVLTVDVPMLGKRERDVRNRLTLPDHLSLKNLPQAGCQEIPKNVAARSGLAAYVASLFDPGLTWKDIEWLARVTKLPVLVKGILRADDALRAVNQRLWHHRVKPWRATTGHDSGDYFDLTRDRRRRGRRRRSLR
jgi:4-hydroxymandelate oxidase